MSLITTLTACQQEPCFPNHEREKFKQNINILTLLFHTKKYTNSHTVHKNNTSEKTNILNKEDC
jgi:hypothetical protein